MWGSVDEFLRTRIWPRCTEEQYRRITCLALSTRSSGSRSDPLVWQSRLITGSSWVACHVRESSGSIGVCPVQGSRSFQAGFAESSLVCST